MIEVSNSSAKLVVDDAVRRLVTTSHFSAGSIVSMPVTYPSGTSITLEVSIRGGRCLVSDGGGGFQDAEMSGAARYFTNEATRIAASAGIRFDGRDLFATEIPAANLRGAMVAVANASAEAASAAVLRLVDRSDRDAQDVLFDRLTAVYRSKDVQRDVQLVGQSNHKWRISILVLDRVQQWMFEPVTGNYISAVGTAAKFHDFAGVDNAPARAAVIKSRADMKDFYGLIAGASTKVLEIHEPDETFLSLMSAA